MVGKEIRLNRILNRKTGKTVIVPMDHGVSSGPIAGIVNIRSTLAMVAQGGANAVVVHKGVLTRGHGKLDPDTGLIVHLSGSTALALDPNAKTLVCSVEEAMKMGADAVSVHVNIGNGHDNEMLSDLGRVARSAAEWGMPLMAMIYPRGENVKNEYDVQAVKHAARLGAELGADIVKVSYTGSVDGFREVVNGCHAPVVIAGGPRMGSDLEILTMVRSAMDAGAAGTSIGRNVFQHRNPAGIVAALSAIVCGDASVDEAMDVLAGGGPRRSGLNAVAAGNGMSSTLEEAA